MSQHLQNSSSDPYPDPPRDSVYSPGDSVQSPDDRLANESGVAAPRPGASRL